MAVDLSAKLDVNGSSASPLYQYLKKEQGGMLFSDIKWVHGHLASRQLCGGQARYADPCSWLQNFTKFLVDRDGKVVKRYGSVTTPLAIEEDIKRLL